MSSDFLNNLNLLYVATTEGGSNTTVARCPEKIDHYQFYQFTLIPAVLITLSFTVTKQRRNVLRRLWDGRPGLIFPMDTLTRSSRVSYGCSFGTTAFLVFKIIVERTYAIKFKEGNGAMKSFVAILSMFIYGLVFFPLFTSLAIGSVYGYIMGSLYVWMLTGVEIYKLFECDVANTETRILLVLRALPSLACLLYLSLSIPFRMVRACGKGHYCHWKEKSSDDNTLPIIRDSYAGHHVRKLFRKPKVKQPPTTLKERIASTLMSLVHHLIYKRQKGFRYPARMISVLFVALLVVYMIAFELMAIYPRLMDAYKDGIIFYMDATIGREPFPGESPSVSSLRDMMYFGWWLLNILKICIIVATSLACLFAVLNILHMLSSYRANLFALYRGDHTHIPPASEFSNTSHCINSIKFAGFQVGYMIWSFVIQWGILTLLAFICALLVYMIKLQFTKWLLWLLELLWPIVLTVVLVTVVQLILAKYVFLQDQGNYLALDNRNVYFNFTYFMFFYNIFLGLASCVLRILKAMVLGIFFLSRLDNSTLSRRWEFLDPGFKAYVGYMQMEAAHTHPVAIIFCRLMLLGLREKREREERRRRKKPSQLQEGPERIEMVKRSNNRVGDNPKNHYIQHDATSDALPSSTTTTFPDDPDPDLEDKERRRRVAARFNWHVTFTLLHNPEIRVMRKGYMQMLRQAQLMGVHIPVSDRQADVNMEQLQERLADAKERMNPSSKKKEEEDEEEEEDPQDLKEVVTAVENGDVKKAMGVSSVGVLAAQVKHATAPAPPECSAAAPRRGGGEGEGECRVQVVGGESSVVVKAGDADLKV